MSHTRQQLEQELFECRGRVAAFERIFDVGERERCRAEADASRTRAVVIERTLTQMAAGEARETRRVANASALVPRTRSQVARQFIWDLGQYLIGLSVELDIIASRAVVANTSASVGLRVIRCAPVLSERAFARALHEIGHVAEPEADPHQQRYIDTKTSVISPRAECAAWLWAITNTYRDRRDQALWTVEMHGELQTCLNTYASHATPDEREAIQRTIGFSFSAIRPAPDSLEGREEKVEQIERELKVEWQPGPETQTRVDRLHQITEEHTA